MHTAYTESFCNEAINALYENFNHLYKGLVRYNSATLPTQKWPYTLCRQIGSAKLYHYGGQGVPLLVIPSLINKPYILDLNHEQSFLWRLAEGGARVYLLDWGEPEEERSYNFKDYLSKVLLPMICELKQQTQQKITLAGYCMGGLFAVAANQLFREYIAGLITIATPWDFRYKEFGHHLLNEDFLKEVWKKHFMNGKIEQEGRGAIVPKPIIQLIFYGLHQHLIHMKFIEFGKGVNQKDNFIEIENWVNDGVDMALPLFNEFLDKFIWRNLPLSKQWKVGGEIIKPERSDNRSFVAIAKRDNVTPLASALPLAISLRKATIKTYNTGHLGMIINAKHQLADDIINWMGK